MDVNTKLIFEDKIDPINGTSSKFKVMPGDEIYCEFVPSHNQREKFDQHFVRNVGGTFNFRLTTKNFENILMGCYGICYHDGRLSVLGHPTTNYYEVIRSLQ